LLVLTTGSNIAENWLAKNGDMGISGYIGTSDDMSTFGVADTFGDIKTKIEFIVCKLKRRTEDKQYVPFLFILSNLHNLLSPIENDQFWQIPTSFPD
jgi:hypothetical protein